MSGQRGGDLTEGLRSRLLIEKLCLVALSLRCPILALETPTREQRSGQAGTRGPLRSGTNETRELRAHASEQPRQVEHWKEISLGNPNRGVRRDEFLLRLAKIRPSLQEG